LKRVWLEAGRTLTGNNPKGERRLGANTRKSGDTLKSHSGNGGNNVLHIKRRTKVAGAQLYDLQTKESMMGKEKECLQGLIGSRCQDWSGKVGSIRLAEVGVKNDRARGGPINLELGVPLTAKDHLEKKVAKRSKKVPVNLGQKGGKSRWDRL